MGNQQPCILSPTLRDAPEYVALLHLYTPSNADIVRTRLDAFLRKRVPDTSFKTCDEFYHDPACGQGKGEAWRLMDLNPELRPGLCCLLKHANGYDPVLARTQVSI